MEVLLFRALEKTLHWRVTHLQIIWLEIPHSLAGKLLGFHLKSVFKGQVSLLGAAQLRAHLSW